MSVKNDIPDTSERPNKNDWHKRNSPKARTVQVCAETEIQVLMKRGNDWKQWRVDRGNETVIKHD